MRVDCSVELLSGSIDLGALLLRACFLLNESVFLILESQLLRLQVLLLNFNFLVFSRHSDCHLLLARSGLVLNVINLLCFVFAFLLDFSFELLFLPVDFALGLLQALDFLELFFVAQGSQLDLRVDDLLFGRFNACVELLDSVFLVSFNLLQGIVCFNDLLVAAQLLLLLH